MAEKNDRIDSLTSDLEKVKRHVQTLKPDQVAKALRQEVSAITFEAEAEIAGKLREGFTKLAEHAEEHGADHRTFMVGALRQIEIMIVTLRQDFHLPDDLDPSAAPDWLNSDPDTLPIGTVGA
ncbi:hypothetical protein D9M69_565420 [compost metagenome]